MQPLAPTSSISDEMNATSLRVVSVNSQQLPAFHETGEPAPLGYATMKFSLSATVSISDHASCCIALERNPCMLMTSGVGLPVYPDGTCRMKLLMRPPDMSSTVPEVSGMLVASHPAEGKLVS